MICLQLRIKKCTAIRSMRAATYSLLPSLLLISPNSLWMLPNHLRLRSPAGEFSCLQREWPYHFLWISLSNIVCLIYTYLVDDLYECFLWFSSRFFTASSKPLRKTSFFSALKENHEESDVEETENETIDSPEAKIEVVCWDESLRDLNQTHEKSNSTAKSAKSPAYPSCGLSSKLSRFKSKFEFKNSPGVSTPFKPVGSPASQKSLCRTLSGNSIDASQPNSLVSSQGSIDQSGTTEENQESETSLCSQQTQLYSMDMDCWDLESLKSNSQTPDSPLLPQPPSDDWHTESPTKTPSPQSSQKSITSMLSSQSKRSDIYMTPSPKMSNKEISSEDSVTRTPSNIKTTPLAGVKSGGFLILLIVKSLLVHNFNGTSFSVSCFFVFFLVIFASSSILTLKLHPLINWIILLKAFILAAYSFHPTNGEID